MKIVVVNLANSPYVSDYKIRVERFTLADLTLKGVHLPSGFMPYLGEVEVDDYLSRADVEFQPLRLVDEVGESTSLLVFTFPAIRKGYTYLGEKLTSVKYIGEIPEGWDKCIALKYDWRNVGRWNSQWACLIVPSWASFLIKTPEDTLWRATNKCGELIIEQER